VWNEALGRVPEAASVAHLRRDTVFAATGERPTGADYNRYLHLLYTFREHNYSPEKLFSITPFRVADVGFNSIMARANEDLAFLRKEIGGEASAVEYPQPVEKLWDESAGFYFSLDTITGEPIRKPGIGSFLPLFADPGALVRRCFGFYRLGSPHVCQWDEHSALSHILVFDDGDCRAVCH
jgi:hypothetical protein